jgi:hypothetical protein
MLVETARMLTDLGLTLLATRGTAAFLAEHGIASDTVNKAYEGGRTVVDIIKDGGVQLVLNTTEGAQAVEDSRSMRAVTLADKIPYYTTLAASHAAAQAMKAAREGELGVRSLQGLIEAAERLWSLVQIQNSALMVVELNKTINFEKAAEIAESDAETREFFAMVGSTFKFDAYVESLKEADPQSLRPYVTQLGWAYYEAYSAIITFYTLRQKVLEIGAPAKILTDENHLKSVILEAMPHQAALYEKFDKVYPWIFLEPLRDSILLEVKKMIAGNEESKEDVQSPTITSSSSPPPPAPSPPSVGISIVDHPLSLNGSIVSSPFNSPPASRA